MESITVADGHPKLDSRNDCNALIWTNEGWDVVELLMGCKTTVIPDGVTQIAPYAFAGTGVKEVVIPNSTTTISDDAFDRCESLSSLHIGSGLTQLLGQQKNTAFNGCWNLSKIVVDEGNPLFDSRENCNAVIETATNTLLMASNSTTVIPEGVTSIGGIGFDCCRYLKSLKIPASLADVNLAWGPILGNCQYLTSIVVDENNPIWDSRSGCNAIIAKATNTLERGCMNTVIPEDVESIGFYAFSCCNGLEEITIPDKVNAIWDYAFFGCRDLRTVTFGKEVKELGANVFPLEAYGFLNYASLETIIFKSDVPPVFNNDHGFSAHSRSHIQMIVPEGSLAAYLSAEVWKDFEKITEGEGVIEFESDGIFYRAVIGSDSAMVVKPRIDKEAPFVVSSYSDSIVIPETIWYDNKEYVVNAIGIYAFYGCELRYLSIPATVKEIGYDGLGAFFYGNVICYAAIPPKSQGASRFGVSYDAVLRVPKGSMELYEQAEWWRNFWHYNAKIEAIEDVTGIERVEVNVPCVQTDTIYDLSGRRITNTDNLKGGIYIVNGKKVVIK